jgi:hypothetical protein
MAGWAFMVARRPRKYVDNETCHKQVQEQSSTSPGIINNNSCLLAPASGTLMVWIVLAGQLKIRPRTHRINANVTGSYYP